jgi:hypothetical protein
MTLVTVLPASQASGIGHRASASRFNAQTFNFRRSTFDLHRSCLVSPPSTEQSEGVWGESRRRREGGTVRRWSDACSAISSSAPSVSDPFRGRIHLPQRRRLRLLLEEETRTTSCQPCAMRRRHRASAIGRRPAAIGHRPRGSTSEPSTFDFQPSTFSFIVHRSSFLRHAPCAAGRAGSVLFLPPGAKRRWGESRRSREGGTARRWPHACSAIS